MIGDTKHDHQGLICKCARTHLHVKCRLVEAPIALHAINGNRNKPGDSAEGMRGDPKLK